MDVAEVVGMVALSRSITNNQSTPPLISTNPDPRRRTCNTIVSWQGRVISLSTSTCPVLQYPHTFLHHFAFDSISLLDLKISRAKQNKV
jgi:hypothetical protein